jgi:RNA polymerase sigma factor (sigma-70 family)
MVALMLGAALTVSETKACAAGTSDKAIADIQRYCSACWRNARIPLDSWTDCTQEVLCRLMQRVPVTRWDLVLNSEGEERKEFVRAIDAVKKRSQRSRKWSALNEDVVDRRVQMGQGAVDRREELNRAAEQVLSVRQRRILQMSIDGFSVQDMANALTMSPERVSDEKYKAIRKLRRELGLAI